MRTAWLFCVLLVLVSPRSASAIALGQLDDFQDGGDLAWSNGTTNVETGGPSGADDRFLQYTSDAGGPQGRMIVFNTTQWSGDYLAAGVTAIALHAKNLGSTELHLRLSLGAGVGGGQPASSGTWFTTSAPQLLSVGSDWTPLVFLLSDVALERVRGTDELATALTDVDHLRILSSLAPDNRGDFLAGSLGLDDIQAVAAPEASQLALLGLLVVALGSARSGGGEGWLAD